MSWLAWVELDKGIIVLLPNEFEGIIPVSKLSESDTQYEVNDDILVEITEINQDQRKILLNIKNDSKEDNPQTITISSDNDEEPVVDEPIDKQESTTESLDENHASEEITENNS